MSCDLQNISLKKDNCQHNCQALSAAQAMKSRDNMSIVEVSVARCLNTACSEAIGTSDEIHDECNAESSQQEQPGNGDACSKCQVKMFDMTGRSKCANCVFEEVKAGLDVDNEVISGAVSTYQFMLGHFFNEFSRVGNQLAQKNFVSNMEKKTIQEVTNKMAGNLNMLLKITDNELNMAVGNHSQYDASCGKTVISLLHSYRMHMDVLCKDLCVIHNIANAR